MPYSQEEIDVFGAENLGLSAEDYQEIVGIDRASGGPGYGVQDLVGAQQVLSALRRGGPGYNSIQRRAALQRPALRPVPLVRKQEVQVPIVVFGTAGQTPTASVQLMQHFRPEKLIVTEQNNANSFFQPAQSQILTGAFVGAMNMFPTAPGASTGIHCSAFATNSQGNGIMWATAKPAITVSLQVNFLNTGTFWGVLYGATVF